MDFKEKINIIKKNIDFDFTLSEILRESKSSMICKIKAKDEFYVLNIYYKNKESFNDIYINNFFVDHGYGCLKFFKYGNLEDFSYKISNYINFPSLDKIEHTELFKNNKDKIVLNILREFKKINKLDEVIDWKEIEFKYKMPIIEKPDKNKNVRLCHNDFHNMGNLLINPKTLEIVQLIDFESAGFNNIESDLATLFLLFYDEDSKKDFEKYLSFLSKLEIKYNLDLLNGYIEKNLSEVFEKPKKSLNIKIKKRNKKTGYTKNIKINYKKRTNLYNDFLDDLENIFKNNKNIDFKILETIFYTVNTIVLLIYNKDFNEKQILKLNFFNQTLTDELKKTNFLYEKGYGNIEIINYGEMNKFSFTLMSYIPSLNRKNLSNYIKLIKNNKKTGEKFIKQALKEIKKISDIGSKIGIENLYKDKMFVHHNKKLILENLTLCHNDLHNFNNILIDSKTKDIIQFIDFEELCLNEVEYDLAWLFILVGNKDIKLNEYEKMINDGNIMFSSKKLKEYIKKEKQ